MFDWLFGKKKTKKQTRAAAERKPAPSPGAKTATPRGPVPAVTPRPEPVRRPPADEPRSLRTADDVLAELDHSLGKRPAAAPAPEEVLEMPVDANLARHLLAEGPITREFIQQQIAVSGKADSYLCRLLGKVRAPAEQQLFRILAAGYDVPAVDLKQCRVPLSVARSVSPDLVRRYKMIPIDRVGDLLCVAFAGEVNPKATEAVRRATGLRVKAFRCPPQYIDILLGKLLHEAAVSQVAQAVPISEAEYQEAMRPAEERWESIHATAGPLRALRIA
ncbi:MAG TPA: hypothetical protein PLE19_16390 [Planctomycetota bacterium]|nr:hypothetical protein [Planctomycetota bacterium]HRR79722.1 hypothetical protein [Planctomycetota bacterium]HRT93225.1 hypothetical protein [Planctomycetota bacterium]